MLEQIQSFAGEPRLAVALAAALIGLVFGALSESSQYCLLGGLKEARNEGSNSRLTAYFAGVLAALAFTQILVGAGVLDLSASVYLSNTNGLIGLIVGGLIFGLGAAMTRGCAGRLTVLAASGNLRAMVVILVAGVAAYATMRGILAPPRLPIEAIARPEAPAADLATTAGLAAIGRYVIAAVALIAALALAVFAGAWRGFAAVAIGATIAAGWSASVLLGDDGFDKLQPWSGAFIAPLANGVQYLMTYTGAKIDFGVAFLAGALGGAFLSSLIGGRFRLQGFDGPRQMLRYLGGAILMGFGGVMALGCTTGQGLSGVSTLSPGSFLAIAAIAAGMWIGIAVDSRAAVKARSGAVKSGAIRA
ncbi:MAG: hypothetical protein BGP04_05040 [Rhizobiales bacterium 62-17]|jgi:hypothetical protein|nr:YeeE/YedE family protein [Hyphomicrobiales bacterium]OJY02693.1 MAG: hypothetical protein BGP04_05040 [Rhizobiales bacterium 62-17]HEV2572486.1 YeeE/YedE family protein [Beijerinckiaceae bacterium]